MKTLKSLLNLDSDIIVNKICTNSKKITKNDIFVCVKAVNVDRHNYIEEAFQNGACYVIGSKDLKFDNYLKVENPDEYIIELLNNIYDFPLTKLKLIGITGTDGKTTTTKLIQRLIGEDKCAYIGTSGYSYLNINGETENTTPSIEILYELFDRFIQANIEFVAMEASSEGFYYNRLKHLIFDIGGYTSINKEHLNTHKTIENYVACKANLFKQSHTAILNNDDKYADNFKEINNNYLTYGYSENNDLFIKSFTLNEENTIINYQYQKEEYQIISPLIGKYNIENLSLALLVCLKMGLEFHQLQKQLQYFKVAGRFEIIKYNDIKIIIDFVHTENGILSFYDNLKLFKHNKIITVKGEPGSRDSSKRAPIGKMLSDFSDIAIFTSDDPRYEEFNDICDDMSLLITKDNVIRIEDRQNAINYALDIAKENDIVCLLGKGDEIHQIIKGKTYYHNDLNCVLEYISNHQKKM